MDLIKENPSVFTKPKKHVNPLEGITYITLSKNSSPGPKNQIQPFLKSPGCPKDLASFRRNVPRPQKSKFLKNEKASRDIHPRNKCANVSQIRPFLKSPDCPKHTQTDRHAHRHSQILAQLKLRKTKRLTNIHILWIFQLSTL